MTDLDLVVGGRNRCVRPYLPRSYVAGTYGGGWGRRCPPFRAMGVTHEIWQGEGGEQGDPLMPALYACGQHRAVVHVSEHLLDTERLFAFMDDIYVSSNGSHRSTPPVSGSGDVGARVDPTPSRQNAIVEQRRSGARGMGKVDGRSPKV